MAEYCNGREVYCVITDAEGNTFTTETATMTRPPVELAIVGQPEDGYAAMGEKFTITVQAQGDGLTYQWYYRESYWAEDRYEVSAVMGKTYSFPMTSYRDGRTYYCVITDQYGNTVTTDVVGSYCAD